MACPQIVHVRERFYMWGADADIAYPLNDISGKFERIWLNKWENI
jgi:hypothetical protein